MTETQMYCLVFAAFVIAVSAVSVALYEHRKRRKTYCLLDEMMERVLEQEEIGVSDVQEGEISALANRLIRIQDKLNGEIFRAYEEKDQIKSLISNMSHQLNTPFSNLVMYQELLEEEESPVRKKLFLKKMKQQLEKIDWILQSLFKMVKLEQGVIQFEVEKKSIRNTLLDAVNMVYDKADKKGIRIITEPFEDCLLLHNMKWTSEVFSNILENAIKYSENDNEITIQVQPLELFTEIRITDHGIGIRKEELTNIFKRFYRSKEVENREGSGIGLYLSRLILEKEKGYMTVASEYGKSSSFSVFLQNCQI